MGAPLTITPPTPREPLWRRNFILVCLSNLAVFAGFQMLTPTIPVYVESLGGQATIMGLVMGIFTLAAVGVRPFVGWALNAIGRKQVFLFGLAVFIVSALAYRWAPSIGVLLALRFVHGFGWGFSTTAAGTIAADVTPKSRLGEGMGYFGGVSTIAMATGPALGLFLINRFDFPTMFYASAGLACAATALAGAIRYAKAASPPATATARSKTALIEVGALRPSLVMLLSNTAFGAVFTFIALYGIQRGIANIGLFFTVFSAALLATRPVAGILLDRRGANVVVVPGLVATAAGLVLLSQAQPLWMFLVAGVVYGVGFGAVQPSLQTLAVRDLPRDRVGLATGTFYNGFDLGIGLGSVLGGIIAEATGYSQMYLWTSTPVVLAPLGYRAPAAHKRPPN